ncbi:hypothetical protein CC1G_04158 [Coprinopsis cinerea okayama7|uniref:F-box domain-containing protein n=1 Tax=Coprinopsis cinerea (strain Okayama-7 / 130 / ATCC MYA-4618 / FGSC 9003) TaxID=240176 RepID=A8NW71_COPC7|nr:hypothetical protein CC1G_04158 [Coprinopsis cinerea okayama7\|eukprot:XP_001836845.2 hypothetical protein CC1G_04158 [Coprinopsis cinerea okayama7\
MASRRKGLELSTNSTALAATLPLEIMAMIFAFALPTVMDFKGRAAFLVIRQVCRSWRSACFNIPELWTSLSVETSDPTALYRDLQCLIPLEKLGSKIISWFSHSGSSRPLSLRISTVYHCHEEGLVIAPHKCFCDLRCDRTSFPPHKGSLAGIEAALNAYASRIESLDFNLCEFAFYGMMRHLQLDKFTILRSFRGPPKLLTSEKFNEQIKGEKEQRQLELALANLRNIPSLQKLTVPSLKPWLTDDRILTSSLTELELKNMEVLLPADIALINKMESLRTLFIRFHDAFSHGDTADENSDPDTAGIHLERITTLRLHSRLETLGISLQEPHLRCPSMRSLHLHIGGRYCVFGFESPYLDKVVYEALVEYLEQLDSPLEELIISGYGSYGVSQHLRQSNVLAGIRSVTLEACTCNWC